MSVEGERFRYAPHHLADPVHDRVVGWGGVVLPPQDLKEIEQNAMDSMYDDAAVAVTDELERITEADYLPNDWRVVSFSVGPEHTERVAIVANMFLAGANTLSVIHNQVIGGKMRTSMWVLDEVREGHAGISFRYNEVDEVDGEWDWPSDAPMIKVDDTILTLEMHGMRLSTPREFMPNDDDESPRTLGHIEVLNGLAEVLKICTADSYDDHVENYITERRN